MDETGVNAVEFIINHAEVSLVFVQEKALSSVSPFRSNQSCYRFHYTFLILQEEVIFSSSNLCLGGFVQILACHKGCSSNLNSKLDGFSGKKNQ